MNYGGHFDPELKQKRIKELEIIMNSSDFWNDKKKSEEVINELNLVSQIFLNEKLEKEYKLSF